MNSKIKSTYIGMIKYSLDPRKVAMVCNDDNTLNVLSDDTQTMVKMLALLARTNYVFNSHDVFEYMVKYRIK